MLGASSAALAFVLQDVYHDHGIQTLLGGGVAQQIPAHSLKEPFQKLAELHGSGKLVAKHQETGIDTLAHAQLLKQMEKLDAECLHVPVFGKRRVVLEAKASKSLAFRQRLR